MKIIPYVSVDTLCFSESTIAECVALYGNPKLTQTNCEGIKELHYADKIMRFGSQSDKFRECTVLPETEAMIGDIDFTWDLAFLRKICLLDGAPVDVYGFIVMLALGIAVTGIHDNDRSQLAVTIFSKGEFDDLLKDAKPFDVNPANS